MSGRPQMAVWRMRIACCIPKATTTYLEYVILLFHCNNGCTNVPQCYVNTYCYLVPSVKTIIDNRNILPFICVSPVSLMFHFSVELICKRSEEIGDSISDNRTSSSPRIAREGSDSELRRRMFEILLRAISVTLCTFVWV